MLVANNYDTRNRLYMVWFINDIVTFNLMNFKNAYFNINVYELKDIQIIFKAYFLLVFLYKIALHCNKLYHNAPQHIVTHCTALQRFSYENMNKMENSKNKTKKTKNKNKTSGFN